MANFIDGLNMCLAYQNCVKVISLIHATSELFRGKLTYFCHTQRKTD